MSMMSEAGEERSRAEQIKLAADVVLTVAMIAYLVWTLVDDETIAVTLRTWRDRLATIGAWRRLTEERAIRRQTGHVIWEAIKTVEGTS
jgi:hypothetical protein